MDKIKIALSIKISKYYWTDSSVVLHWIHATNKKLPVFVAHRIGEIQEFTATEDWNHVGTKKNPADLVSREITVKKLISAQLWWNGPAWLKDSVQSSQAKDYNEHQSDRRQLSRRIGMVATTVHPDDNFINKFSSFQRLEIRITTTCLRFVNLCKKTGRNSWLVNTELLSVA